MPLFQSTQVAQGRPVPTPLSSNDTISLLAEFIAPPGGLAIGDVIEMGGLPAYTIVVDGTAHFSAGATNGTLEWGLLSGIYSRRDHTRTGGTDYSAAFPIAGAGLARLNRPQIGVSGQVDDSRGWGFVVRGAALPSGFQLRAYLQITPSPIGMT